MTKHQATEALGQTGTRKASPIELSPIVTGRGYVAAWSRWVWDDRAEDWDHRHVEASTIAHVGLDACRAEVVAILAVGC